MILLILIYTEQIPFNESNLLDGVIRYLQRKTQTRFLNEINIVTPTASSSANLERQPTNIFLDNSTGSYGFWRSDGNITDSWFQMYFHKNAVLITDYIIKAYDWDFLKEWEVYCSLDNERWHLIDHQKLTEEPPLEDTFNIVPYHVKEPLICRYFKIVQKDQRFAHDNYFILHKLEFFGVFYNYSTLFKIFHTCGPHILNRLNIISLSYISLFTSS